jgi:23S rRNA pseudouridine1911/1915/1917 synthase
MISHSTKLNNFSLSNDDLDEDIDDLSDVTEQKELIELTINISNLGFEKKRLDQFLTEYLKSYSRSRVQQWIKYKFIKINGNVVDEPKINIKNGDHIYLSIRVEPKEFIFLPEPIQLDVVFQDSDIFIINKPAGLVVHPGAGNWSGTLLNGLLNLDPLLIHVPRAGIVHRLDKETSGLMVIARNLKSHTFLVKNMANRLIKREYLALLWGEIKNSTSVEQPIGRNERDRTKMTIKQNGKEAKTFFQPLWSSKTALGHTITLVCCRLETGRTHQIRVHAQYLNKPLVNDPVYGNSKMDKLHGLKKDRQFLQAFHLGLEHPTQHIWVNWKVNLAQDLWTIFNQLESTQLIEQYKQVINKQIDQ